jgi:hypothetical protein
VSSGRKAILIRLAKWLLLGFAVMAALLCGAYSWWRFHPKYSVEFVGPAGARHRAFVENRSFQDIGYVLCVSDWPYTFLEPLSVESVLYSEGSDCRVFWSADGSVVVARDSASSELKATYDYKEHVLTRYDSTRMQALIDSRGGLGPEFSDYRDGKETYDH